MRVKVKFPAHKPLAIVSVPVRIGDVNYGGHVGNDAVLSIMHEARLQALTAAGMTELEAGGHGLIMADVMIAYRAEAFYGDELSVALFADEIYERSFDLLYRITALRSGVEVLIAEAKTGMICFDYQTRRLTLMSDVLKSFLSIPQNRD